MRQGNCCKKYKSGKEVHFILKPISIDALNHPYIEVVKKYEVSPYKAYRTQNISFKKGKKQKISKGTRVVNYTDPESGISFFRVLADRKNNINPEQVNKRLLVNHIEMINAKYSCVFTKNKGNYTCDYEVNFLNEKLISYTSFIKKACFTSSIKSYSTYHNYNLIDGEEPILDDLFWFDSKPKPELKAGDFNWMKYRYNVFGPKVLEILTALYPQRIKASESSSCNYNAVKMWQFPIWHLTFKGVFLRNKSFDEEKCGEISWSVIPFEILKDYISKEYKLID